ncbi:MFS transporter [Methanofollis ethanolicus]|uniref:MFS transporter n=1 Tax=Methanofollis ethanolicus TaxID=488124 RepID=UPI0008320978|nr:MFS transporter [Methanofollis ethanolicus]
MSMPGNDGTKWGVLAIVCMAIFIMVIDTTIMNVSISALVVDLDTTVPAIQAVIAIYALVMASFMIIGGKLQDVMGRKKVFLVGLALYGVGTFTASISQNVFTLLLGWAILEGLGAALMLPATTTFITATYEGAKRAFAFGMWGGVGAAGMAFGPIIGGYLTAFYSWRWAFRLELVVVFIVLIFSYLLTEAKPTAAWRDLDIAGTLLSFGGLGSIVLGILIIRVPEFWGVVPIILGIGILCLAVFYLRQKHRKEQGEMPLIDVVIFGNRTFTAGNGVSIVQNVAIAGFLFIIPIFLQSVTGIDAFTTGLTILPMSLAMFALSVAASRLAAVVAPRTLILIGFAVAILGTVMLRGIFSAVMVPGEVIPGSVVFGIGMGIVFSQVTNLTLSSTSKEQESDASGILNTAKQMGTSFGTAIVGVVLLLSLVSGMVSGIAGSTFATGASEEEITEELVAWAEKMKTGAPPPDVPEEDMPEATAVVDASVSGAMQFSFDAISVLLALGLIATFFIPSSRRKEEGA